MHTHIHTHTLAEIVAEILKEVLQEWDISDKLSASTTDNARNVVKAVEISGWSRIPCFAHTLQLAIQTGLALPAVSEVLAKCRKIVGHFKHSHVAQTALEVKQGQLGLPPHKLIQEVKTRWNSTYDMASRLLEQKGCCSRPHAFTIRSHASGMYSVCPRTAHNCNHNVWHRKGAFTFDCSTHACCTDKTAP